MSQEAYQIIEEYGNQTMPYQRRVVHTATGITKVGNCRSESSIPKLIQDLIAAVEADVPKEKYVVRDNTDMGAKIAELQAQIDSMRAAKPEKKKPGRPAKVKAVPTLDISKVIVPPTTAPEQKSYKPGHTVAVSNKPGYMP